MSAPHTPTVRPLPEAFDWEGLAWLMGIPKGRPRENFIWWLQGTIEAEWQDAAEPPGKPAGWRRAEIDADITKTGRAFVAAIKQRGALLKSSELAMASAVEQFLQQVSAPKRGAPKRTDGLGAFLEHLLNVTYGLGGHVSFNRKTGKGNVVDLLDELRPLMPERFIPNELPMSMIERLSAKVRGLLCDLVPDRNAHRRVFMRILEAVRELQSKQEDDDWNFSCTCPDCGQPLHDAPDPAPLKVITGGRASS